MIYGAVAEFTDGDALLAAVRRAREAGYQAVDAYAPFVTEELTAALLLPKSRVPLITLLAGIAGGLSGYFMMWFSAVIHYPINVGGRPLHSWPAFVPITFELTILFAALAAVFGMFALNGLPRFHHPIFNTPHFAERNAEHFYLCIRANDAHFAEADAFLRKLSPFAVWEVPE